MKFSLPTLNYAHNALEPYIDEQTMLIHHTKHHQAYVDKLNAALEGVKGFETKDIDEILRNLDQLPNSVVNAVRNNGGGVYNHNLFWQVMGPNKGGFPEETLLDAINESFGSFQAFQETFETAAATRFGSGWAWLIITPEKKLKVVSTPNQDVPFSQGEPLLTLDVWEHAYYLKYQNRRPEYIKSFWNVVNWDFVQMLFEANL